MQLLDVGPDAHAGLIALWQRAWQAAFPDIDFAARRPWLADRLRTPGLQIIAADRRGFLTLDPATGEIDQLAVAPEAAGAGIATALLAEARRRRPEGLHLSVNQANTRAIRLYHRAGFRITAADINPASGLPIFHMRWP